MRPNTHALLEASSCSFMQRLMSTVTAWIEIMSHRSPANNAVIDMCLLTQMTLTNSQAC